MSSTPDLEDRLTRVRKLIESDLAALLDRNISLSQDAEAAYISDDNTLGGVSFAADTSGRQAVPVPSSASGTIQPASTPEEPAVTATPSTNEERRFVWNRGAPSSFNPTPAPAPAPLTLSHPHPLPPTTLTRGDVGHQQSYAPIVALSKYPYKFCNKGDSQDIASAFFDAGKFWGREWDLYYVWDIEETRPLILVSESQFESLLREINSALHLSLQITSEQRAGNLVAQFPNHPRCQPRYLGRSKSREEYNSLIDSVPGAMSPPTGEPTPPSLDKPTLADFKKMFEDMVDNGKAIKKGKQEKAKVARLTRQKSAADQFKRAQRYLGLRPVSDANAMSGMPAAIDVSVPVPFPYDQSVVFVCVDVEEYEFAKGVITEIGIATLDTRELSGVAPGQDGENWRPLIRARHFRIQEHSHLVNSTHIIGCPDRFDFGTSEWVKRSEAAEKTAECFKAPFSGSMPTDLIMGAEQRNLIFLGHATMCDVTYLQTMGFDPLALPNVLETQDTQAMYQVWHRDQNPTSLGAILYDFDIAGFNLHNSGNDAVFTVQAMLAICVREASLRDTPELKARRDAKLAAHIEGARQEAAKRAADGVDGWSDAEADGDGGDPVKVKLQPKQVFTIFAPSVSQPDHESGQGSGGDGGAQERGVKRQRGPDNVDSEQCVLTRSDNGNEGGGAQSEQHL